MQLDHLESWKRSHYCGDLRKENIGETVTLMGWVDSQRDHGGVIFIDLRDHLGFTQVVFNPEISAQTHQRADALRNEFVIGIRGKVVARDAEAVNDKLATGAIEIAEPRLREPAGGVWEAVAPPS